MVCAAALASAAFAAPTEAAKLPDLTIAGYELNGQRYAFEGERGRIIPHDITRNRGSVGAGPSTTRAYLLRGPAGGASEIELGKRAVPRLGPNKQSEDDIWDPTHVYNYPIGAYLVEVCADDGNDVRESNENNNCALIRNPVLDAIKVYVVRRTWVGHLGGVATMGPVLEQYKSNNAKLIFDSPRSLERGTFAYTFQGTVTYTDSGDLTPCSWTGGRTRVFGPGGATADGSVTFNYLNRWYAATALVDDAFSFSIRLVCGGKVVSRISGPRSPLFFKAPSTTFPFGATEISGSNASAIQNWTWGFH